MPTMSVEDDSNVIGETISIEPGEEPVLIKAIEEAKGHIQRVMLPLAVEFTVSQSA